MGANNTPIPDLIEISGVTENTTYSVDGSGGGTIFGVVDNATYTDEENNNSSTEITELNETGDADHGVLTIDGVEYSIELVEADSNVGYTTGDGGSGTISATDMVFIIASPTGGGATRYFALIDDDIGDVGPLTTFTTGDLDYTIAGDDTVIDAEQDNNLMVVCFDEGTRIAAPSGLRSVETLISGEDVLTLDRGAQRICWTAARTFAAETIAAHPQLAPIRIAAGAFGPGLPVRDLLVSPQHRILLNSRLLAAHLGMPEVLVPAVRLLGLPGVQRNFFAEAGYLSPLPLRTS